MKKPILLLSILALAPLLFAQGTKSVNSIKRSTQYLYAEATMDTADDAYVVAKELLVSNIKEYVADKKSFRDKDILVKDIVSRCDSIQLSRGEMFKVFLYVKKSDILDVADNITLIGEAPIVPVVPSEERTVAPAVEIIPDVKSVPSVETVPETTSAEEKEPVVEITTVEDHGVKMANSARRLPVKWQQDVIDHLLAASSFDQAKAMIGRYKAEYKIKRYGPESTCRDRSGSFWLIGSQGRVATVLGPGDEERTDFRNMSTTTMENYAGQELLWFVLSK